MTVARKMALSVAAVILAILVGYVVGAAVMALIPYAPLPTGGLEATPAHVLVFVVTFTVVASVGSLLGVLYVWFRIN